MRFINCMQYEAKSLIKTVSEVLFVQQSLLTPHTHTRAQTMTIPGTTTTVQFIFIDTILMCGTTDPLKRSRKPRGPQSQAQADEEWAWINETLQQSTADWIIMGGHYPGKE